MIKNKGFKVVHAGGQQFLSVNKLIVSVCRIRLIDVFLRRLYDLNLESDVHLKSDKTPSKIFRKRCA